MVRMHIAFWALLQRRCCCSGAVGVLAYAPPAVLYAAANVICAQRQVAASTHSLLSNTFILFTAVFLSAILKRRFTCAQALSLVLLAAGTCLLNALLATAHVRMR